jgi:predicted ATPase/DNA-binding CsgD family transcriptional regulator
VTADLSDLAAGWMMSPAGYIGSAPTALIGRADDLERLAAVLAAPDAGLVSVTGPAGVGKSRLVMEFFCRHAPAASGAVEVFDFGRVADASACGLMLQQLREPSGEGARAIKEVFERFGDGRHTVLLDHYEDVAAELAPLLAEFRRCCPQVRVVAIGTTRLGLYGERIVRLAPLATASGADVRPSAVARIPAVELFVEYARSVRPEFMLTAQNARSVLALCELLGGLPLAIELAAAQVKLAGPELILQQLEGGHGDLHRTGHHPYSRHSSIGDLTSWVFARLDADERTLLNKLAIFEGSFTMRAAAEVVGGLDGGAYRTMERLIDKSVLMPGERHDGELSLGIPSIVRIAAARSLAQSAGYPALRQAHGEYFRAVARAWTGRQPAAGERPDVPADVAGLLTTRELEVALLVAEGLTNRGIAHKLGIAEWTVVNHLRKVMRKLECQSRVHVTRRLAT